MSAESELSSDLRHAYHAALLLTADAYSAERAVMMAIESLDPTHGNADLLIAQTIQNAIQCCAGRFRQTPAGCSQSGYACLRS